MIEENKIINQYLFPNAKGNNDFPYRELVDKIFDFIQHDVTWNSMEGYNTGYFSYAYRKNEHTIQIPYEIHKKYGEYKRIGITIKASKTRYSEDKECGICGIDFERNRINIYCRYNEAGDVFKKSTYGCIFNALNLLYIKHKQKENNENLRYFCTFSKKDDVFSSHNRIFEKNWKNKYLFKFVYTLFNEVEVEKILKNLSFELMRKYHYNGKRDNFDYAVKNTEAYTEYFKYFNDRIDALLTDVTNEETENLKRFFSKMKLCSMRLIERDNETVLETLSEHLKNILSNFLHRICIVVSLYYSELIDLKNQGNIIVIH